ncbi:hypothetical protein WJX75_004126 [Coccomyxa subellipsoidea]|uniref:Eukaryotic translation initiation factor 5B n=1 Tax=Coccomyxa subellipsoidea TaxID=248742 RepID=A0ABR2YTA6_9CHLO
MAPKKAKKKNNKLDFEDDETGRKAAKAVPTFAVLQEDASSAGEEETEEDLPSAAGKKGGFAALTEEQSDGEGPDPSQTAVNGKAGKPEEADTSDEVGPICAEIVKFSRHPNADRLKTCQVRTATETLQVVTNAPNVREGLKVAFAGNGVTTAGSQIQVSTATVRGVKSFGMICSAHDLGWMEEANGFAVELPQEMEPGDALEGSPPKGALLSEEDIQEARGKEKPSKGKKGKKSKKDIANAFDTLGLEDDQGDSMANGEHNAAEVPSSNGLPAEEDEDGALNLLPKQKKGKNKKGAAGDEEATAEPESTSKAKKSKKKAKQAAAKQEDEDLDALLAELGEAPPAKQEAPASSAAPEEAVPEEAAAEGKSKGKKAKKKAKQAAAKQDEDDLDALLAELGEGPAAAAPQTATAESQPADTAAEADADTAADGAEDDAADTAEMSAAAKKKAKKKAKEKAKKAAGTAEGDDEEAAPAAPKKGAKKESAAVRRMREALEKQEREAEEAARAEAERIAKEEEAARLAEEAEAAKAADAERRKAERLARRAEAKRQGLILTGKAKREAERLAAMREQILKNAKLDEAGEQEEKSEKKKVVYGKKKPGKRQDSSEVKTAEEEEREAAAAKAELEAQKQQEEELRRQEEEARRAEEEAAARAAAEAHVSESEEDTNWEDMDLDAVKLPGVEEEPSAAEVAKRAAADAAAEDDVSTKKSKVEEEEAVTSESDDEDTDSDSDEETSSGSDDSGSSDEESSSEEDSSSEMDSEDEREARKAKQQELRAARVKAAQESGSRDNLRSPICCILGHVDTGKTKLLDNVRRTSVQEGEAGGITQQIGATYVPGDAIRMRTEPLRKGKDFDLKLPGLLIIDTPGHESFTNLRSRGSGLCDIAILVVDIMHGMEPQTKESIELLKMRKTPFIVALNKVDRLFEWQAVKDAPIMDALERQKPHVKTEFEQRLRQSILNLNEQGLNVALYWKNPDVKKYVNIVPTSAISGEGIPDMLQLLVKLTQSMMAERLMYISEIQCTVLEVKVVEGLGTTVDVVLVNGVLHEGATIVLCGMNGPIVTNIRSLLTPHPLKELRVKGSYLHHKEIQAAQGVKIAAQNLESAIAGTQMLVLGKDDDLEALKDEAMQDMEDIFKSVDRSGEGVCVQASTLGSLEALLEFLRSPAVKIPVSGIAIGPIHKKDVMRASVMLEKGRQKYAVILAFDVPVTKEARELSESLGVRIFTADIIYHLFDQFTAYLRQVKDAEQEAAKTDAVFPCILKILPTCVFNTKDPIVLGVDVVEGIAKVGTPICVPSQGRVDLGKITSLELNHKPVDRARKGESVAMKIEATNTTEATRLYGRHFDHKDELVSRISRKSINLLKEHFKDDMRKEDWQLVIRLKKVFNID